MKSSEYDTIPILQQEKDILEMINAEMDNRLTIINSLETRSTGIQIQNKHVIGIKIDRSNLTKLPANIGSLNELKIIRIAGEKIVSLPDSINQLTKLEELYLTANKLNTIPENLRGLEKLRYLELSYNQLEEYPESINQLKNIEKLSLAGNKIRTIPQSIKNLKSLIELNLSDNLLSAFPKGIGNLSNLSVLNFKNNNFEEIPPYLALLENIKTLYMSRNPIKDEEEKRVLKEKSTLNASNAIKLILNHCKKKLEVNVLFNYARDEYDYFQILEIANYFVQQKEIEQVYIRDQNPTTKQSHHINNLTKSKFVLFFASKRSIESKYCLKILNAARKKTLPIIPIKGEDISWSILSKLGLSRILGFKFEPDKLDSLMSSLYEYIWEFKREIDLYDKQKFQQDKIKFNLKNTIRNLLQSTQFQKGVTNNKQEFNKLFEDS
ncbi:MAG: leucine-rich repeat domain-containing protein [Promethearchaeota archaeon]|nr:MAG: leucine-rich repeat domain-containing protein [Candidatus Lokiarchaeota archaeon]